MQLKTTEKSQSRGINSLKLRPNHRTASSLLSLHYHIIEVLFTVVPFTSTTCSVFKNKLQDILKGEKIKFEETEKTSEPESKMAGM